jgi:hypothetical protein
MPKSERVRKTDVISSGTLTNEAVSISYTPATSTHVAITLASSANALLGLSGQQLSLLSQAVNTALMGPETGASTNPTFRSLVVADLPIVTAAKGGTGQSSYAVGDLLYASGATALSKLADVAVGSYLRSGGVTTAPLWSTLILPNAATAYRLPVATSANTIGELAAVGATGEYLAGATGAIPAWAALNQAAVAGLTTGDSPTFAGLTLTADLTVANGGTGVSTLALNGILFGNAANAVGVTAIGAQFNILTVGANPFVPAWSGYLLDGTTGGKTILAVTNAKVLTLTAADSYNLTIQQTLTLAGASGKVLTLTDSLTNQGGFAGTLSWGAAVTLSVELASAINQDVTSDAGPTFDHLHLSGAAWTTSSWAASIVLPLGGISWWAQSTDTLYSGFGNTSNSWYWITSTAADNSAAAVYPMSLTHTGDLTLMGDIYVNGNDVKSSGVLAITPVGNLTLNPSGDVVFDPTGNDLLPNTTYDLNLGGLTKKYLTVHAAELWVETLVAQDTMATIGGRILVGATTQLTAVLGDAAGDTTLTVKHNEIANGDVVYLETGGKVEFLKVTSAAGGDVGAYTYTIERDKDGSGRNAWDIGDAVFNTGAAGDGWIDLYSVASMKSGTQYGPTIVGNVRVDATYNNWVEAWAIGNLHDLYGYADNPTYGVGLGKYLNGNSFVLIDATNGIRMMNRTGGADVCGELAG